MKALRKVHAGPDGVQLLRDIPIPEPDSDEVLIKVEYAALCGTDIHIRDDAFPVQMPVTMGHEFSGTIVKLGDEVTGYAVGDHVIAMTAASFCGQCELCRQGLHMLCNEKRGLGSGKDGAFAEYLVYKADRLFKLPNNVDVMSGALSEPLACVLRGVLERSSVTAGDYVYISGPGVMGQFAAQLAKLAGAFVTVGGTGQDAERLILASEMGADDVIDITAEDPVEHARRVTKGHMYDIAYECSASPKAFGTCIDVLKKTGRLQQIALYGKEVSLDLDKMLLKEITLSNSYASERSSWERLMRILETGAIQTAPYCSIVIDIENWEEGMRMMENHEGYKILFRFQ